jgi:hypothetical protein
MSPRNKRYNCPCCGTPMSKPGIDARTVHLGANQQALFNLLKANASGISVDAIRNRILTTNRDGDSYNSSIVAVMASHINKKIKPWGLRIQSTGGPGSVYRLIQI